VDLNTALWIMLGQLLMSAIGAVIVEGEHANYIDE